MQCCKYPGLCTQSGAVTSNPGSPKTDKAPSSLDQGPRVMRQRASPQRGSIHGSKYPGFTASGTELWRLVLCGCEQSCGTATIYPSLGTLARAATNHSMSQKRFYTTEAGTTPYLKLYLRNEHGCDNNCDLAVEALEEHA